MDPEHTERPVLPGITEEQLRAYLAGQEQEMALLKQTIARLESASNSVAAATPTTTTTERPTLAGARPRARMPELDKFDGDRRTFRAWLINAKEKLKIDLDTMGGAGPAFSYIFARLGPKAQALNATFFTREEKAGRGDPWAFLAHLESVYADRGVKARAIQRLNTMKKTTRESFAAFFPRFETEIADAGFDDAADDVKIAYLERAIDDKLADRTIGHMFPTYAEYVTGLFMIAGQIEKMEKRGGITTPPRQSQRGNGGY